MIKKLLTFIKISLIGQLIIVGLFLMLIFTQVGLYITYQALSIIIPGKIQIEKLSGSIVSGIRFDKLIYYNTDYKLIVKEFESNWGYNLNKFFIEVEKIKANRVDFETYDNSKNNSKLNIQFPIPSIKINDIDIKDAYIKLNQLPLIKLSNITSSVTLTSKELELLYLNFGYDNLEIKSDAKINFSNQFETIAKIRVLPTLNRNAEPYIKINLDGDVKDISAIINYKKDIAVTIEIQSRYNSKTNKINAKLKWSDVFSLNDRTLLLHKGNVNVKYNLSNNAYEFASTPTKDTLNTFIIKGHGDSTKLTISKFVSTMPYLIISSKFELAFAKIFAFNGNIKLQPILDCENTVGNVIKIKLQGEYNSKQKKLVVSSKITGENNLTDLFGEIKLILLNNILSFEKFNITHKDNVIKARGNISKSSNLDFKINVNNLSQYNCIYRGNVSINGNFSGNVFDKPQLAIKSKINDFIFKRIAIKELNLSSNISYEKSNIETSLTITGARFSDLLIDDLILNIDGKYNNHKINISGKVNGFLINSSASGNIAEDQWNGLIDSLNVTDPLEQKWAINSKPKILVSEMLYKVENFCMISDKQKICFGADFENKENWQVAVNSLFNSNVITYFYDDINPACPIQSKFLLSVKNKKIYKHHFKIGFQNCNVYKDKSNKFLIKEFEVLSSLKNIGIKILSTMNDDTKEKLNVNLFIKNVNLDQRSLISSPINGKIEINFSKLDILERFFDNATNFKGNLVVNTKVSGTISEPLLYGNINLTDGQMKIISSNVLLQNIVFSGKFTKRHLNFKASTSSDKGIINIVGKSTISFLNIPSTEMQINGKNFKIYNTEQTSLYANPALKTYISSNVVNVTGEITIPKGHIIIKDFSSTLELPDEVIIIDGDESTEDRRQLFNVKYEIQLNILPEVYIDIFGIEGKMKGNVKFLSNEKFTNAAFGEINVIDGKYNLFGKKLNVDKGKLIYTGAPFDSPNLDILATTTIPSYKHVKQKFGIIASGKIKKPQLSFYSSPDILPPSDILSYLTLGSSSDSISDVDFNNIASAMTMIASQNNDQSIITNLMTNLKLDQLGISTQQTHTQPKTAEDLKDPDSTLVETSSLVVGKNLTPYLNLTYNYDTTNDNHIVKTTFKLFNRFSVLFEGSQLRQAVNLLYDYEFWTPSKPD